MGDVITHDINLETLEAATTPFFSRMIRSKWEDNLSRGFGSPQINIEHTEFTEDDTHTVTVMLSFQGSCSLLAWRSRTPDDWLYYHATPKEIEWMYNAEKKYHDDRREARKARDLEGGRDNG